MFMIRPVQEKDAAALAELMTQLGYPTVERQMTERIRLILNDTNLATFVAVESGIVCGMVGISTAPSYAHDELTGRILALVVSDHARGRGVGRKLVAKAEDYLRAKGVARLIVTTRFERKEAHRFYAMLGFAANGFRFKKRI